MMEFNQEGFPVIRFHEDFFEVKAIDFWEFRSFRYDEIADIDYYHSSSNWIGTSYYFLALNDPYIFKIKKTNGADWKYFSPKNYSREFAEVLNEILNRSGLNRRSWG